MKIQNATTEQIRERMGADATTTEAERMLALLNEAGYEDTDEVSDAAWFEMVSLAATK